MSNRDKFSIYLPDSIVDAVSPHVLEIGARVAAVKAVVGLKICNPGATKFELRKQAGLTKSAFARLVDPTPPCEVFIPENRVVNGLDLFGNPVSRATAARGIQTFNRLVNSLLGE